MKIPYVMRSQYRWFILFCGFGFTVGCFQPLVHAQTASPNAGSVSELRKALTFHAPFDNNVDANFSIGDPSLWSASDLNKREEAVKGLPASGRIVLDSSVGRFGGSLRFLTAKGPIVFYRAKGNIAEPRSNWSGTVSFWLSTDPEKDLVPGFCDPIQITSKQWDDAAMFVEFEKRPTGIPFRLGVYADKNVWNPNGRKFEDIPLLERPLASVEPTPFAENTWVHVVFVFERFNTNEPQGASTLYLNGKPASSIPTRTQTFTWDANKAAIMLGLGYVGRMDDLAIFNRALSEKEVQQLNELKHGIADIKP